MLEEEEEHEVNKKVPSGRLVKQFSETLVYEERLKTDNRFQTKNQMLGTFDPCL